MMKKIVVFLVTISFVLTGFSQAAQLNTPVGKYVPVYINFSRQTTNIPMQKTEPKGSVYLADDFYKAKIILKDSSYIEDIIANYNFYSNYIEIIKNDTIKILNLNKVDWIILDKKGDERIYANGANIMLEYPEIGKCNIVEVLSNGTKAVLFDKMYMEILQANYNAAVDAGETSDTYVLKHEYFILKNNELIKIKKTKGSILSVLSDQEDALKTYIKQNKLKMKEPQDMAKVIDYYNSIYEQSSN